MMNQLAAYFDPEDIEWRIQSARINQRGQPVASALAYITNRAISNRLDAVCGIDGWQNEFHIKGAFVLCGISIRINDEWITKWDGAEKTAIEGVKGGLSSAMKRAASTGWGIGRYLYNFPNTKVTFVEKPAYGADVHWIKIDGDWYAWETPQIPDWAYPQEEAPRKCNECNERGATRITDIWLCDEHYAQYVQEMEENHGSSTIH